GRATLRSGIRVATGATEVSSSVAWSSLMLDADSRAQTSPSIEVDEADAEIVQEGKVRKVGEEMLFYMSSRGVPADEATRLVYLDSAATSQKPKQVIDATSDFYARYNANVHRAIYELGEEATREYEGAREKIAVFIRAKSPNEIVFTKSTTEALNVVAYGYGLKGKLQPGDEIVGTVME